MSLSPKAHTVRKNKHAVQTGNLILGYVDNIEDTLSSVDHQLSNIKVKLEKSHRECLTLDSHFNTQESSLKNLRD
jgi:hypothetical protein